MIVGSFRFRRPPPGHASGWRLSRRITVRPYESGRSLAPLHTIFVPARPARCTTGRGASRPYESSGASRPYILPSYQCAGLIGHVFCCEAVLLEDDVRRSGGAEMVEADRGAIQADEAVPRLA